MTTTTAAGRRASDPPKAVAGSLARPSVSGEDVPAAHSMDTTWFAVDADGCVGVFESGEDGAVPNDAALGINPGDPTFDVFPLDVVTFARALAKDDHVLDRHVAHEPTARTRVAVVLAVGPYRDHVGGKESASLADVFPSGEWFEAHRGMPRVFASMRPIGVDVWRRIAQRADVVAILDERDVVELLDDDGPACAYRFAFDYGEEAQPGLYTREHAPDRDALKLDDLPTETREAVSKITLPIRFEASASVHLADHLRDEDCGTWSNSTLRGEARDEAPPPQATPAKIGRAFLWVTLFVIAFVVLRIVLGRR